MKPAVVGPRAFDHVELPGRGDEPRRRLSPQEFEALPLEQRVSLLVQGTLRFYRGEREVRAVEAMKAPY